MAEHRMARVNELLKREIGNSLFRFAGEDRLDIASVTITRVETSPNLREARVYVSIRAEENDPEATLRTLKKHRGDFQKAIASNMTLKYTPRLFFEQDASMLKGHRVLSLLAELEDEEKERDPETDPEQAS